ncbi:MAG TPA: DMT family transporter [Candidatus Saccharimonadia bacterium]|nr:DMT family transporter [Candidatus Saccharimonadia bacterium]
MTRAGASLALVIVMVIWGASVPITKAAIDDVPPVLLAWLRFVLAAAILFPSFRARRRAGAAAPSLRDSALLGLTGIALYYLGYNIGLQYTSASHAALLQSAVPALTAVLAYFWLRERLSLAGIAGVVLSVIGVLLIVSGRTEGADAPAPLLGNSLVIAAIVSWSVYTIFAKRLAQLDPLVVTVATALAGVALLAPAVVVELALGARPRFTPAGLAAIAYLGVVGSALAYALYGASLRVLGAGQVATYVNLMPVVAIGASAAFLGERIDARTLIGGAIVLTGVALATLTLRAR